ncbi:uncharacterized protein LOC124110466 isoform X1 [Haliotis rufescens]|uniref:uncharacterized protein LOC124110466 isoform X1 n=2 Tax=Haliotis rufescens TaxID=6454 RepID=UPI00201F7DDD|nr:uncharacterized protein LOC124110466 isoform X1 [Haliotis rufescens]
MNLQKIYQRWIKQRLGIIHPTVNPRMLVIAVAICSVCLVGLYLLVVSRKWTPDDVRLSYTITHWEGFGEKRGAYNFTVVTGMLDIGRGSWSKQSRSYNKYLIYMSQVLRLDVNMVVYIEEKGRPFVEWMRRGRGGFTKIRPIQLSQFPYYKYKSKMQQIMDSEEYQQGNELLAQGDHVEATNPDYDILQLSKIHLVNEAVRLNPFNSTYFFWMDGGYGHGGEGIFPPDAIWKPDRLTRVPNKLSFLVRGDIENWAKVKDLHKKNVNILVGGVFGGGIKVLSQYHALHSRLMREWMARNIVDDDQTANMQLYFRHRSMFNLVRADWFDIFKVTVNE